MIGHGGAVDDPDTLDEARVGRRDDVEQVVSSRRLLDELPQTTAGQHFVEILADTPVFAWRVEVAAQNKTSRTLCSSAGQQG